ncbi:MAG: ATP-binding cassette domain-containing protein [Desulfobacterales bacterium]|jgi:ABC-type multidrug transport system ATPase subunit
MRVECKDLGYRYPAADASLINRLSFTIDGPGFHALFGPSGVGKTTLALMLAGQIRATTGTVDHSGIDHTLYSYNLERLPDWGSIDTHLKRVAAEGMEKEREPLLTLFGLSHVQDSRFSQLSLGQKNRINLIRYLLQDYDMLIMDESLANVDEKTREKIIVDIKQRYRKKLFLYISHNIVEVATYCRKIMVMRSPGKSPQGVVVDGLDTLERASIDRSALERSMLEIMNAA